MSVEQQPPVGSGRTALEAMQSARRCLIAGFPGQAQRWVERAMEKLEAPDDDVRSTLAVHFSGRDKDELRTVQMARLVSGRIAQLSRVLAHHGVESATIPWLDQPTTDDPAAAELRGNSATRRELGQAELALREVIAQLAPGPAPEDPVGLRRAAVELAGWAAERIGRLTEANEHLSRHGLTFGNYQEHARRTAVFRHGTSPGGLGHLTRTTQSYVALALAQTAGDIAGEVAKAIRDDSGTLRTPERTQRIRHKAGNLQWFLAALCDEFSWSLAELAVENLEMLSSRAERGLIHGEGWNR